MWPLRSFVSARSRDEGGEQAAEAGSEKSQEAMPDDQVGLVVARQFFATFAGDEQQAVPDTVGQTELFNGESQRRAQRHAFEVDLHRGADRLLGLVEPHRVDVNRKTATSGLVSRSLDIQ